MINRKLLKTNRWEDEKYLEARMTNACFNGGGGGDGMDDVDMDDFSMGGYSDAVSAGLAQVEREAMGADIDRQMAEQAQARERAETAAQIDRQMQAQQVQRDQEAAAQQALAERQRANEFASVQQEQQARAAQAESARQSAINAQMVDEQRARQNQAQAAAAQAADVARQQGANQQEQEMAAQAAATRAQAIAGDISFSGYDQAVGSTIGRNIAADAQARRDIAADDYMGSFIDPTALGRQDPEGSGYYDAYCGW